MINDTYSEYLNVIDQVVSSLDRTLSEVKRATEGRSDRHKIIGDTVAIYMHILASTMHIVFGDPGLTLEQKHNIMKTACEKARNILQKHLPRAWRLYLDTIRRHVSNRRMEVEKAIHDQVLE